MTTTIISENVEVIDIGSVIKGNPQLGSSLVDEKVECSDSLTSDVNGFESMAVEEQCGNKEVARIKLKKKRKEKLKVECSDSLMTDVNGFESMVVMERCDDKKVARIELKKKRKKEKLKELNRDSNAEISLVDEKVECSDSLMKGVNGFESMVVEEQCDGKKVARMELTKKRKKEKLKALKMDSSAEISLVNNESSPRGVSCPEMKSKGLVEFFDVSGDTNSGSAVETSLIEEKDVCFSTSFRDGNDIEPLVAEGQIYDVKVSRMELKRKRKEDKEKALKKNSSAEMSSVNNDNESSSFGALIPEVDSKILVKEESVSVDMISSSCVDVVPSGNEALIKPVEEANVSQSLSVTLERPAIQRSSKKLLILDVNGLLADLVPYTPYGLRPDTVISMKSVFKRPYSDDFLKFCFDRFNVGIWSSRTRRNVEMVIDFLMGDTKHKLLFCWDHFHCTKTGFTTVENREKPLVLKELRRLWENIDKTLPWKVGEYDESNTLLLDDSPYKALLNPAHTAIFPYSYRHRDHRDSSLGPGGDLRMYLERLADAENVQKFVAENPYGQRAITESNASWGFYRKIIKIVSSRYQR